MVSASPMISKINSGAGGFQPLFVFSHFSRVRESNFRGFPDTVKKVAFYCDNQQKAG
jgi:hypothetical protein